MKRFGSQNHLMHPMNENDLFLARLSLLIIVVKATMKGYPMGTFRRQAALRNARFIHRMVSRLDLSFLQVPSEHLLKERVKLLAVMATAIVGENYPLGIYRREAVMNNIATIESQAFRETKPKLFHAVLNVA